MSADLSIDDRALLLRRVQEAKIDWEVPESAACFPTADPKDMANPDIAPFRYLKLRPIEGGFEVLWGIERFGFGVITFCMDPASHTWTADTESMGPVFTTRVVSTAMTELIAATVGVPHGRKK